VQSWMSWYILSPVCKLPFDHSSTLLLDYLISSISSTSSMSSTTFYYFISLTFHTSYSTLLQHYLSTMSAPSDTFQWTDINIRAEPILALHPAFSPLLNVDRLLKLFYIYLSLDFVVIYGLIIRFNWPSPCSMIT
jgi:hypothetical protein